MDTLLKLNVFNDILYYDEPHKYYVNGENLISVTTLLGEYHQHFDEDFFSIYKAIERIMGPEDFKALKDKVKFKNVNSSYKGDWDEVYKVRDEILKEWVYKNKHATFEGSTLHNYIENYWQKKIFPEPNFNFDYTIPFIEIESTYRVMRQQFHNFYNSVKDTLIPVKIEFVVYDLDYKIAGMLDMLFYSKKLKKLIIFDWKTNTDLKLFNDFNKLKPPVDNLQDCELSIYSLQLHIYKHIIEKNTGLKLADDCFIVWFNENNDNYQIIKCLDARKEAKILLETLIK